MIADVIREVCGPVAVYAREDGLIAVRYGTAVGLTLTAHEAAELVDGLTAALSVRQDAR